MVNSALMSFSATFFCLVYILSTLSFSCMLLQFVIRFGIVNLFTSGWICCLGFGFGVWKSLEYWLKGILYLERIQIFTSLAFQNCIMLYHTLLMLRVSLYDDILIFPKLHERILNVFQGVWRYNRWTAQPESRRGNC